MIAGICLLTFGILGAFSVYDRNGFLARELPMDVEPIVFYACVIMALIGAAIIFFAVIKKRNSDDLKRINNMQSGGVSNGICPNCGLNLSNNAEICPQCHTSIKK